MSVFQLILPDFLLIGLGWLLFRKLNFKQEFFKGAEQLVYFVLFPALLFHSITQTRLDLDSASLALQSTVAVVAAGIVLSALAMPLLKPPPMAYAYQVDGRVQPCRQARPVQARNHRITLPKQGHPEGDYG